MRCAACGHPVKPPVFRDINPATGQADNYHRRCAPSHLPNRMETK